MNSCGSKTAVNSCQAAYYAAGRKLKGAHRLSPASTLFAATANRGSGLELRTLGGLASDPSLANFTWTVTDRLGTSRTRSGTCQHSLNRFVIACISLAVSVFGSGVLRGF